MLAAVKGYYDGKQIVMDEADRENLHVGDEVIITILDKLNEQKIDTRAEYKFFKTMDALQSFIHVFLIWIYIIRA